MKKADEQGAPPSGAEKQPSGKKELTPGALRARLETIEDEIIEFEKKVAIMLTLQEENKTFNRRLKNIHRAVWGLLFNAGHPLDPVLTEKYLAILSRDAAALPKRDEQGEQGDKLIS